MMTETRTIPLELLERAIERLDAHVKFEPHRLGLIDIYASEQLIADLEAVKSAEESLTMLEIAKQHRQATQIIAGALTEMSRMVVAPEDIKHNAAAIIARLAGEGFVLQKCKD